MHHIKTPTSASAKGLRRLARPRSKNPLIGQNVAAVREAINLNQEKSIWRTSSRSKNPLIGQNVAAVREAINLNQEKSIWRTSSELNINATAIQRILKGELRLFSYKIQVVQQLELKITTAGWQCMEPC